MGKIPHGRLLRGAVNGDQRPKKDPYGHLRKNFSENLKIGIKQPGRDAEDESCQKHGQRIEENASFT